MLWLPLMMALILIAADATTVFMRQSHMWQVSRDTARIVSRHGMTEAAAEDYINRSVVFESISPEVDVTTTGA